MLDENSVINSSEIASAIPYMLPKMRKWIKKLEYKIKSMADYMILDSTKYTYLDEDVEVPGESMNPRDPRNFVKLVKVLPIGPVYIQLILLYIV